MNRRDLIIVAVIINAGLLVTLFVSSLKREEGVSSIAQNHKPQKIEVETPSISLEKGKDQIDQMISQYTAMVKAEEKKEEIIPPPILAPPKKVEEKKAPPQTQSPTRIVTVQKGDVLEKIARNHGVSIDEIMKLNNLSNSRLQIGQELKLPERKAPKKETKIEDKDEGKYYVVKGGDNPWTIAQKNHIQIEELLRLNNMDQEKAKQLRPGDRLRIK